MWGIRLVCFTSVAVGCVPRSSLAPPSEDERLIDATGIEPATEQAPEGTEVRASSTSGSPEESGALNEKAIDMPFAVVLSAHFPRLVAAGDTFALSDGNVARLDANGVDVEPHLSAGIDACGAMEMHMFGVFPGRAWLQVKFPPFGESPPQDRVYRYAPGAKRWAPIKARVKGGAELMVLGDALVGYETHWGGREGGATLRLFDGTLKGPLPPSQNSADSGCPDEIGLPAAKGLGNRLLVMQLECDEEQLSRRAAFWDPEGQVGKYQPLPFGAPGQSLSSGGVGPASAAGAHAWIAFEEEVDGLYEARLVHHFEGDFRLVPIGVKKPLSSVSALADGTIWFTSGDVSFGAELYRRRPSGALERITLPKEVLPLGVLARTPEEVWVATEDSVLRLLEQPAPGTPRAPQAFVAPRCDEGQ